MMNYFEYKGYIGIVSMSAEDRCFFGTIQGINDLVTFEGDTVQELEQSFQEAVDDYLDFCKENDLEPEKAYKGQFNVRVKPELHRALAMEAAIKGKSLNCVVEDALESHVNQKPAINITINTRQLSDIYKAGNNNKDGWTKPDKPDRKGFKLVQGGKNAAVN